MVSKFSLFIFCIGAVSVEFCACTDDENTRCMAWAFQRIVGGPVPSLAVTDSSIGRPGKAGPRGPPGRNGFPGQKGEPGPSGVCDCRQDELRQLQQELAAMKAVDPVKFCLLGMKNKKIPTSAISASSNTHIKYWGRLDSTDEGWEPKPPNPPTSTIGRHWIGADLGKVKTVTGVVTQGKIDNAFWVKTFKVKHSLDGITFSYITDNAGHVKTFSGNTDGITKVANRFSEPVSTRFVRIIPTTFHHYMVIRFDILGC